MKFRERIGIRILRTEHRRNHLGSGGSGDGWVKGGFAVDERVVIVGESSEEAGIGRFVEGRSGGGALRESARRGRRREGIGDRGFVGPEDIVLVEFIEEIVDVVVVVRVGVGLFKETHEADGGRRR